MNAQTVSASTRAAVEAMEEVCSVVDASSAATQNVAHEASEVSKTSDQLRAEMEHFLGAMANSTDEERRRYERVPGNGVQGVLASGPRQGTKLRIVDISRGGVALACDWCPPQGQELSVAIGDVRAFIAGRVIGARDGVLAVAFRQDGENLTSVDRALGPWLKSAARAA